VIAKRNVAMARPPEPAGLLDNLVGYRLRRASARMMSHFLMTMEPLGLRPVLFAMLETIRAQPGIIQQALGTQLGIQRANLVPLINELTSRDLIERRADPSDRRALRLFLTGEGGRLLEEAELLVLRHEEDMLEQLSPAERRTLLALLDKIKAD